MPIENRKLKAGTKLVARYRGKEHSAEIVRTKEGVRYRLADGREFKSPSGAGSAVMGGTACNGWRFWSVAGEEPKVKRIKPKKTPQPKTETGNNRSNGLITRLDDGRYFCSACQEPFEAPAGVEPQGCPKGHRAEGSDA